MKKTIWILLDNRIGSRHQAEGVAHYLDLNKFNIINKEIIYTKWASLPNFIRSNTLIGISPETKANIKAPWPDFVLSASRRTAPVARFIKKQSPKTKLIQLLHIGRWGTKDFSLIFTPKHDSHKYQAPNIKYTLGSPHFITKEKLEKAKQDWQETFKHLPHPITALIIGGSIKKRPFTIEQAKELATAVKNLKNNEGGSLLITTSRRTGEAAQNEIMSVLNNIPNYAYLWGSSGENPYLGYLACADNLIVTGDSVSMCCEATGTGKPLRIYTHPEWLTKKHLRFVQSLYNEGYAVSLTDEKISPLKKSSSPLNVAQDIAIAISNLE